MQNTVRQIKISKSKISSQKKYMKTKLLLLILLVTKIIFVNAQMDDKFYFPKKDIRLNEWKKQQN